MIRKSDCISLSKQNEENFEYFCKKIDIRLVQHSQELKRYPGRTVVIKIPSKKVDISQEVLDRIIYDYSLDGGWKVKQDRLWLIFS